MTSVKLLKIIFVILLLVTLGELVYYVYYQAVKIPREDKSQATISINPIPTLLIKETTQVPQYSNDPTRALNLSYLYSLSRIKKGVLASSIIKNQFQGAITEIDMKGGTYTDSTYRYKLKLVIKGTEDPQPFFLTEDEISKIKVMEKKGDKETPYQIESLKVGDRIIIQQTIDLIKKLEDNLVEMNIYKIY